jgi:hypothetical protein
VTVVQVHSLIQDSGAAVLALLDRLCGDDPPRTNECAGEVVTRLVHLRNQLIDARRANIPCDEELYRTNAILSSVFGVEFPISGLQRRRIREARDALKEMLRKER